MSMVAQITLWKIVADWKDHVQVEKGGHVQTKINYRFVQQWVLHKNELHTSVYIDRLSVWHMNYNCLQHPGM